MDDRLEKVKKILKYVLPILVLVIILLIILGNKRGFNDIEKEMIVEAEKYLTNNNIRVESQIYITIDKFNEIEGTALCLKSSGVIVKNENGSLKYTPYLKCNNYESSINNNKNKIIELSGGEVIILNMNEVFDDPLYTLKEDADIINSGTVYNQAGVYDLIYDAYIDGELKERAIRKVIRVVDDKSVTISGLTNSEEPMLTLKGDKNITLSKGEKFLEQGYVAYDYVDGKISRQVKIGGEVNSNKIGVYVLTYTVENSRGRVAMQTRTIEVVQRKSDLNININLANTGIASSNKITITVSGSGYDYMILPDRTKTIDRTTEYQVSKNGEYQFIVHDIYGNKYTKSIQIDNIDNIKPTGSCTAKAGASTTQVNVTASDNKGIAGYTYILDGERSELLTSNEYSEKKGAKKVEVEIQDLAGNTTNVECKVEQIVQITTPTQVIACKGDRTEYNNQIAEIIRTNGSRTRATATALGRYLSTEIGVKIPYFWAGGHWHYSWDGHDDTEQFKGVSPMWGCVIKNMRPYMGNDMLPAGIDCTGFVAWILFNAGFKKSEIGSFSGSTWLTRLGGKKLGVVDFKGSTGKIKAGDIVWRTGHMGFIIDVDGETVTIAHEKGTAWGLVVEKYSSRTGRQIGGSSTFMKVMQMDNYYN